jgi:hypothetical protein
MEADELVEHGPPQAPPAPLPFNPDADVPLSVWRRGDIAAVLYVTHDAVHADDDGNARYSQYIEFFHRTAEGWVPGDSVHGSDWPLPYGERPEMTVPAFTGFAAGQPLADGPYVWVRSGIAPRGVVTVIARGDGWRDECAVEPVSGAFLASAPTSDAEMTLAAGG